jgi:predicted aspartyl protease
MTSKRSGGSPWAARLPMAAAAIVFGGLSVVNLKPIPVTWIVTRSVAPGQPVTAGDVRAVRTPPSLGVQPGRVARVPLVPGQTLVASDLVPGGVTSSELTLPINGSEAVGLMPGTTIQLAEATGRRVWLSPRLLVAAVDGQGGTPSVVVSAPLHVLTGLLPHAGSAWVIVDPAKGGRR